MIFLQNTASSPLFKYLLIALLIGLVLWRLRVLFKLSSSNGSSQTSVELDREKLISSFIGTRDYHKLKNRSVLFLYCLRIILRGSGKFMVMVIAVALIVWICLTFFSTRETRLVYSSLTLIGGVILNLITTLFQGGRLIYYYFFKEDFKYLLLGNALSGNERRIEAFKKAIEVYPSAYAYYKLGFWVLNEEWQRVFSTSFHQTDHSTSISYFEKAVELDPSHTKALKQLIDLKSKVLNFGEALEFFNRAKKIEEDSNLHPWDTRVATDRRLGVLFCNWGHALLVTGNFGEALEKLSHGIKIVIDLDSSTYGYTCPADPLMFLYEGRAECYQKIGDYESAKQDIYNFMQARLDFFEAKSKSGRYETTSHFYEAEKERLKEQLKENLSFAYLPFRVSEDLPGAIKFLEHFQNNRDSFAYPIFTEALLDFLVKHGLLDHAIQVFDKAHAEGFEMPEWFEQWTQKYIPRDEIPNIDNEVVTFNSSISTIETLINNSQYQAAEGYLKQLTHSLPKDHPRLKDLYRWRAEILEANWKFSEALEWYLMYFSLVGDDFSDERIIGRITKIQGDYEQAIDCYSSLLYTDPSHSTWRYSTYENSDLIELAEILESQLKYQEAIELIKSYDDKHEIVRTVGSIYLLLKKLKEKAFIKEKMLTHRYY